MQTRDKKCRAAYIVFSLLEYLISLLVSGALLAAILKQVGVSDAVNGVVSSVISLSCVTQLFSGLLEKPGRSVRRTVVTLIVIDQFMLSVLYLIPFFGISRGMKTALFVLLILGAHFIENLAHPVKYAWLMGFVDPWERGSFTARKEIVSLIGGMLFTLGMGRMVDHFNELGQERTGFILCGAAIAFIAILCFVSLRSIHDAPLKRAGSFSLKQQIRAMRTLFTSNSAFRKLLMVDILWKIAIYLSTPFFGTYLIGELGFSLTAVSLLGMASGIARALISPVFGRYADKKGFAASLKMGLSIAAAAFLICAFTRPGPARMLYGAYVVMYAISMASINSGLTNITYEYIELPMFAYALGARSAIGGVLGFLVSLVGSVVVSKVQAKGSMILGHTVYAQQILSGASFILISALVIYIGLVISKRPRADSGGRE